MRLACAVLLVTLAGCSQAPDSTLGVRNDPIDELLAARNELRFYDGAPPVIPHAVAELGRQRCLNCHAPGATDNAARIAIPRSHPAWGDCRQCHVEQHTTTVQVANNFEPLRYPATGHRQTPLSPPMIPHTLQNRESCAICHIGEQAPAALRAAHGQRANCRQCHVATVN